MLLENKMSDWNAEHLRVTLFLLTQISSPKEILPAVFGVPVATAAEKNFGSELIAESNWKNVRAIVQWQPGRLDFFLKSLSADSPENDILPDGITLLSDLTTAVGEWVKSQHDFVFRIAVAGRAMLAVKNRDEGYNKFAEKVRLVNVKAEHSDINFQVNIPTQSQTIDGLKINCITAWGVALIRTITIASPTNQAITPGSYFLHCAPDVNTDADRKEFLPGNSIPELLNEMKRKFQLVLEEGVS